MLAQARTLLLRRLAMANMRGEQGVVALEALLSIMLLMALSFAAWAVALVIFNQAIMNSASQMAAHEAILVYDRGSYRDTFSPTAAEDAFGTATAILQEDISGLLAAPTTTNRPVPTADFQLDCAVDVGQAFAPCEQTSGRYERVTVKLDSTSVYYWLNQVLGVGPHLGNVTQHATGLAYSSGPADH